MTLVLVLLIVLLLGGGGYFYAPRAGYTAPAYAPPALGLVLIVLLLVFFLHLGG